MLTKKTIESFNLKPNGIYHFKIKKTVDWNQWNCKWFDKKDEMQSWQTECQPSIEIKSKWQSCAVAIFSALNV